MLQVTTHTSENFPPEMAEFCAETLCKPGSDMNHAFRSIAAGDADGLAPALQIALATRIIDDEAVPIGWASIGLWNDLPAIQGCVFPAYRRRGLASALVSTLTATGEIPLQGCHIFSPHFTSVAKRAGFQTINEWKRVDDGWIRCS